MKKRILRAISFLLAIAMLTEMLPTAWFSGFMPHVYAADANVPTETYAVSAAAPTDNTIAADIPPTIIDNTDTDEKDPITGNAAATGTPAIDISDIINTSKPECSEDDERFVSILKQAVAFSALSAENAAFIVDYTHIPSSSFSEMEADGISLWDSVTYGTLAIEAECPVSVVLALNLSLDAVQRTTQELTTLQAVLRKELSDTELARELKQYILHGHNCVQILNAYGASQVFGISMSKLLNFEMAMPVDLSASESQKIEAFSESLDIAAAPLAEYAIKNGLSAKEIENSADEITQKYSAILSTPQGTGSDSEETGTVQAPYVGAPYTYSSNENEKIALNSGSLVYENTDYVLPGINGLNLEITRRYDSQSASSGTPDAKIVTYYKTVYLVIVSGIAFSEVPGYGRGRWPYYDVPPTQVGIYTSYMEAERVRVSLETIVRYDNFQGDVDLIIEYTAKIIPNYIETTYGIKSTTRPNDYFQQLYGLGCGWRLNFSSIEAGNNQKYLHLATGETYEIKSNSFGLYLKDYPLDDLKLTKRSNLFSNGSTCSEYCLMYQDGKREFFDSDGKLIGIQDRNGNTITFVHTRENGYPHIAITDTLGRETIISGEPTESGHRMTIQLPDGKTLTYELLDQSNLCVLAAYLDVAGNTTSYSYTKSSTSFNVMTGEASEGHNIYLNLTTVTHPTNVQSVYTYEKTKRNLGEKGVMEVYRLTSRKDDLAGEEFNCQTFCYSENDYSGYPSICNPEELNSTYQYSTSVTTEDHTVTTTTFNHKHLPILTECRVGESLRRRTQYTYDSRKQPIQQRTEYFLAEDQNQSFITITAAEYDSKGNITASWSAQAKGSTADTEYRTSYTYDSTFGLLLTKTYKMDADTTIEIRNTLDSSKKNIVRTEAFRNGVKTACTEYDYDAYGNVACERRYHDDFTAYDTTQYTYDRNAYLSQEKHTGILTADGAGAASTPGLPAGTITTDYAYDVLGRMTSVTDGNGDTTAYTYDAAGNVTLCTNSDGTSVRYDRDYSGNKLTVTDENGAQIRYTYTPLGLEYETIDVQSNLVMSRKEYDAQSRLCRLSDFVNGAVTEYTYDTFDRVLSETVLQGKQVLSQTLYSYEDAAEGGLYQKVTKTIVGDESAASIITTQYTDNRGNVVKTGRFLNGTEYPDTFGYDYLGNKLWELSAADAAKNLPFTAKYEYNENNQVIKAYNAAGQSTESTYNALGQLIQATDYAGTPTVYAYDALGRLLSQTVTIEDGMTAVSKYAYDASGNIICEWKPVQAVGAAAEWSKTEYAYNSRKKLISAKQYDGSVLASETTYTYDGVGNMLSMNAGGSTTSYTYDRFGNVLTMTDALGQTETSTYAALGQLESRTDRNGTVTSYTYDVLGRVLSTTAHSGEDTETVTRSYTLTGQAKTEENASNRTQYLYDELGRVVRVAESAAGTPEIPVDPVPAPQQYTVTLDANGGTVPFTTLTLSSDDVYNLPIPTRRGYTFIGWFYGDTQIQNGMSVQLTENATFTARWNANTYTITLDAAGGTVNPTVLTVSTDDIYDLPVPERSDYTFIGWFLGDTRIQNGTPVQLDDNSTLTAHWAINTCDVTLRYGSGSGHNDIDVIQVDIGSSYELPSVTQTGYTFLGWKNGDTLYQAGSSIVISDDISFTAQWSPNTYWIEYCVNAPEEYRKYIEDDESFDNVVEEQTYDKSFVILDNPFKIGDLKFYGWSLTPTGKVKYRIGEQVCNLTAEPNGTVYLYAVWTSDGSGVTPIDPIRPPVEAQSADTVVPESNLAYLKTYTYDLAGNRTSFTVTQDGAELQKTNYLYDDLNRLTAVYADGATQAAYTYDTNGNRASLTYANGATETYRYNKANWIVSLENRNKKNSVSSYTYTYYASGSQKSKTDRSGKVTSYVYDGLNRLIQEAEAGGLTQNYTYDARGNRAAMTVSGTENYTVSYAYDANNRLLTERKTRGLLTDLTTYAYDTNGNLLSKTFTGGDGSLTGAAYTYNLFNQLSAAAENGLIAAYAYNAQGIRTCKATATSQTYFLLDGGNVAGERTGSKTVTYLRGANLISRSEGGKASYYLFNAHGDVTELLSDSGAVTHKYDYDAFGVEKDPDPLDANPFRYCGEYFDRETKTYYLRARYYDPAIGRFTQQDTHWATANSIYGDNPQKINEREDKLGLKTYSYAPQITAVMQSGNLYVYGVGNPVLYADANGAWIHLVIGAIAGAIVSGVVSGAAQYATSGKIDFWRILIAMGSGAVSGLLAATGVGLAGQIAGNALISSVANLGDQLYLNDGDITKTNITDVMIAAFIGATGGLIGNKGGGTPSLDNLTTQLFRRIGNAVKYQSGAAFKQELSKAIAYYAKCATKQILSIIYSILKASIPSVIKEGTSTIDQIFKQYGIGE